MILDHLHVDIHLLALHLNVKLVMILLMVEGLTKTIDGVKVLDNVSFYHE